MSGTLGTYMTPKNLVAAVVIILGIGGSIANTTFRANAADERITKVEEKVEGINEKLATVMTNQAVMTRDIKAMETANKESREDTRDALRRIENAVVR